MALASSESIPAELEHMLRDPYFPQQLTAEQLAGVVALLRGEATLIDITDRVHAVASHPEDDLILAAALSA